MTFVVFAVFQRVLNIIFPIVDVTTTSVYFYNAETRQFHPLSCKFILFDNTDLPDEENLILINAVHKFIKNTKRFNQ